MYKKMDGISLRNTKFIYHCLVFRPYKVVYLKEKNNCYADALYGMSQMLPRRGKGDTS